MLSKFLRYLNFLPKVLKIMFSITKEEEEILLEEFAPKEIIKRQLLSIPQIIQDNLCYRTSQVVTADRDMVIIIEYRYCLRIKDTEYFIYIYSDKKIYLCRREIAHKYKKMFMLFELDVDKIWGKLPKEVQKHLAFHLDLLTND